MKSQRLFCQFIIFPFLKSSAASLCLHKKDARRLLRGGSQKASGVRSTKRYACTAEEYRRDVPPVRLTSENIGAACRGRIATLCATRLTKNCPIGCFSKSRMPLLPLLIFVTRFIKTPHRGVFTCSQSENDDFCAKSPRSYGASYFGITEKEKGDILRLQSISFSCSYLALCRRFYVP